MAGTISFTTQGQLTNGTLTDLIASKIWSIVQTTAGAWRVATSIPTTAGGTVITPLVTTPGYAMLVNLDATNYMQYGPTSGGAMVVLGRLKAGEFALLRLDAGVTLRAMANTAACLLDVRVWND